MSKSFQTDENEFILISNSTTEQITYRNALTRKGTKNKIRGGEGRI